MNIKILKKKRKAQNRWKTVLTYRMYSWAENGTVRVKSHAMKTEHSDYHLYTKAGHSIAI